MFLQMTLLWCFLYFFGIPYILRYQESKVMVVERETDTGGIPAPAITICARNEPENQIVSDDCNGSADVFSCMESKKWSKLSDVVLDAGKGESPKIKDLTGANFWNMQIRSKYECFTFSINERIGPIFQRDILRFIVNNRTRIYEFYIHSSDYFTPNRNPLFMPINRFKVFPKTDCPSFVPISLIEKHELNTVHDPCEDSKEYNFTCCIELSIASQAGCDAKESCVSEEHYR